MVHNSLTTLVHLIFLLLFKNLNLLFLHSIYRFVIIRFLSDFRFSDFDESYGVRMADGPLGGLLARAVVIIGKDGKVTYTELVPEITQEPDYDKGITFSIPSVVQKRA